MLFKTYLNPPFSIRSIKRNVDSLIAGIVGFIIIYLITRHNGIGISPDSITYTAAARNLYQGNGLKEFTGEPMVDFPAFYPLFLSAVLFITRQDIIVFAPILNALLFGLVIYLSGCIMEHFIQANKYYKWILLSCIALSPSLIEVYYMLWSESLFIVLSLLFFMAIKQYFKSYSIVWLLMVSLIASIAFVTRYAGISFIGTAGLLMLFNKEIKWEKKISHGFLFGIISVLLPVINIIRNYNATGTMAGPRQNSLTPFTENLHYYSTVLWDWLSFFKENYTIATAVALLIFGGFVIGFIKRSVSNKNYCTYEHISATFFIFYCTTILVSSTVSRYETINSRLLTPAFIPFIFGVTFMAPNWIAKTASWRVKWLKIICVLTVAFLFIKNNYINDKNNYIDMSSAGIPGYTEDVWRKSATIQFVKTDTVIINKRNYVYSNANHAIYFYTGKVTETIPQIVHKMEVDSFYRERTVFLIWFNTDPNPNLLNLAQIGKIKQLIPLHFFNDGVVYLCTNDFLLAQKYLIDYSSPVKVDKSLRIKHTIKSKYRHRSF